MARSMPANKNNRRRKPSKKKSNGKQLKVLLVSLGLVLFLLLSLILLSYVRDALKPAAPPVPVVEVDDPAYVLEDLKVEIDSFLLRSGVSLAQIAYQESNGIRRFDIRAAYPSDQAVRTLQGRSRRVSSRAFVEEEPEQNAIHVYVGDRIVYLLLFNPPVVVEPSPPSQKKGPRLAILVDDLGRSVATARALAEMDLPLTFAILPGTANAARVARVAHEAGREVLIHIPMEPQGYPGVNPGSDALLLKHTPEEIRRRFQGFLTQVPYAVGGNNHMGSGFTENARGMSVVIEAMREAGLFFVDSRTSPNSIAYEQARKGGVATARRDVFLDNVQKVDLIARQIRKLVRVSEQTGQAIGICHPHPETLQALRQEASFIKSRHIDVVPVSQLLVH